jgi:ElaB/YqjD/DUF883 family membrane-anchored ribosome-binding protein
MSARERIEAESHKDPDQLEREIEHTRAKIDRAVDALELKLSPGELFERAIRYARENGGEFVGNLGATVRANPMPVVLTSVGLLWMIASSNRETSRYGYDYRRADVSRYGADASLYGADASLYGRSQGSGSSNGIGEAAHNLKDRVAGSAHDAAERLSEAGHRIGDATRNAADSVRDSTRHAADSVRDTTRHAADSMRHGAQQARQTFDELMHEQPLAAGAIGIAIGALVAALMPTTRAEQSLMGAAGARVREQARELAGEGIRRAEQTLGEGMHHSQADGSNTQGQPGVSHH